MLRLANTSRFVTLSLMDWLSIMAAAMLVGVPLLWVGAGIVGWLARPSRQHVDLVEAESRRIRRDRPSQ